MDKVIKVKNLNKTFGKLHAVKNISFEVEEGTCFGLLGPNGAGKTTTMSMLYGFAEYDKVESTKMDIFLYDPLRESLEIKSLSGIVPQENNLDQELNVYENLYVYSKFYGIEKNEAKQRIDKLLEFMELLDRKKSSVKALSGGMQRRLIIARALLNNPKLLILDEPTTGLDPQVRHLIWNKLRALKEQGVTILLTTHYMEEAYQICDKIIIMDKGEKIIEGDPKKLLKANIEDFVMEIPSVYICEKEQNNYSEKYSVRIENHRDTCFIYTNNIENLKKIERSLESNKYNIRSSNLEDLFLKVTGRSLNEIQ